MKQTFLAFVLTSISLLSCQRGVPEANLTTSADSMFYALGVSQSASQDTLGFFLTRMKSDPQYVEDFLAGISYAIDKGYDAMDKVKETDDKQERAYASGIMQGIEYHGLLSRIDTQLFDSIDIGEAHQNFVAGFADYARKRVKINHNGKPLTPATATIFTEELGMRLATPKLLKTFGKNKQVGEDFLAKKRQEKDVKTLPSGVLYRIIKEGQGAKPTVDDRVAVRYKGQLTDGTIFDATSQHGGVVADTFAVAAVIPGWQEALQQMSTGAKWEIYIPYTQGYGTRQSGAIAPFSTLVFEVELLGIPPGNN